MVFEVALSLFLLSGAGLLMRSFLVQRGADLGFRADKLLVAQVQLGKQYSTAETQYRFARDLTDKMRAVPGVTSAATALEFPPFGGIPTSFDVAGISHREKGRDRQG